MRQCIFCDNTAKTKEHIWPEWILKRLLPKPIRGVIGAEQVRGHDPFIKFKSVCRSCNNGWMSRLEEANMALIGCLMQDIAMPLDILQQDTLAKWAVKTAMVFASITQSVRETRYTPEERHALRLSLQLPALTDIYLGRYSGREVIAGLSDTVTYRHHHAGMINGYACTILVGRLIAQTFTVHVPVDKREDGFPIPFKNGVWSRLLVRIYPPTSSTVVWPPEDTISDLGTIAHRYSLGTEVPIPPKRRLR